MNVHTGALMVILATREELQINYYPSLHAHTVEHDQEIARLIAHLRCKAYIQSIHVS